MPLVNFVLSGRGLCVGLTTRPEKSYRGWCVWVWSRSLDSKKAMSRHLVEAPFGGGEDIGIWKERKE
jgi:hypothetical protein